MMFFRVTELFAELLTDRNLPSAQNCVEFDLFNGNCKNCWNSKRWVRWKMGLEDVVCVLDVLAEMVTVRNDSLRGTWFSQSRIQVK